VILHRLATLPVWALFTAAISIPILTLWLTGSAAQQRQSPYLFLMNSGYGSEHPHPGDWPNWALGQKARVQ
jgi:hypothetical protein